MVCFLFLIFLRNSNLSPLNPLSFTNFPSRWVSFPEQLLSDGVDGGHAHTLVFRARKHIVKMSACFQVQPHKAFPFCPATKKTSFKFSTPQEYKAHSHLQLCVGKVDVFRTEITVIMSKRGIKSSTPTISKRATFNSLVDECLWRFCRSLLF